MDGNSLLAIEPWIGGMLEGLSPRERKKILDKLARHVRRANARRIAANREPDGASMVPRKQRIALRDRRKKPRRMFRRIGKTDALRIRATADVAEVNFVNPLVEQTAAVHHFGLTDFVGRTRAGRVIRTQYTPRRLLGFGDETDGFLDELIKHLGL